MNRDAATAQVKNSLASYLESQGINLGKNFHCLSGTHSDNKPSMSYKATGSSGYPFVHCFSCGATYDTISLIAHDYGIKPYSRENFEKAYELFGLDVEGYKPSNLPIKPINIVSQTRSIAAPTEVGVFDFTEEVNAAHKAMLQNREARQHFAARHYSADVVKAYRLGYVEKGHNELLHELPDHRCKSKKAGLYQFVYPILDENGKATYFMTEINDRAQCDDYNPKYRKINDLPAPLFNERYLKRNVPPVIFVTEGIPDALSVESVNGKAMALTGVGYTRLIELLNYYKPNTTLVLALDNDKAGKAMTEKLAAELKRIEVRFIVGGPTFKKDYNEELISDPKRFVEEVKKTIEGALSVPITSVITKEDEVMTKKKVVYRQVKSTEDNNKPETQAPKFKDRTKQMLVDMYLDCLKKDEIPWQKGWEYLGEHRNMESGRKYKGKNALLLSVVCDAFGYKDNRWMTFNEITKYREEHGITGQYFNKDAKGAGIPITYYGAKVFDPETGTWSKGMTFDKVRKLIAAGEVTTERIRPCILGTWIVFNCSLVNGIEPPIIEHNPIEPSEYITAIINSLGVTYKEEGGKACYRPLTDEVILPPSGTFKSMQSYYATQLHELSHATGHPSRLNRSIRNKFGSEAYALEELNAEIASSFLCADLKIETVEHEFEELPDPTLNHAAYVQSWIEVLENNPEKLFEAINTAEKIEDYIIKTADIDLDKINNPEKNEDISIDNEMEMDI